MIWLIIIAAIVLLGFVPVGIKAAYNDNVAFLSMSLGPLTFRIYPRPQKSKPKRKRSQKENTAAGTDKGEEKSKLSELLYVAEFILEVLSDFRRKLRVEDFQLKLVLADDDPCDLSVNYARVCALASSLIPQLDRMLIIKNRDINVACDYLADTTRIRARIHLTITIGRLVSILFYHGIRGLRKYNKIIKQNKGGATT